MDDKIIFLDIDGVLNVYDLGRDEYGNLFHPEFENNLCLLIQQTNAKIVISSSWRIDGLQTMKNMWIDRNLAGEVIGITPTKEFLIKMGIIKNNNKLSRGYEIQYWINTNNVKKYVIIDDTVNDMLPSQKNNIVQTSNNIDHLDCVDIGYGLTRICTEKAIEILNKKDCY